MESTTIIEPRASTPLWKTQLLTLVDEAPIAECVPYEENGIEYSGGLESSGSISTASSYISLVSSKNEKPNIMDMDIKETSELEGFAYSSPNSDVKFNICKSMDILSHVSSEVDSSGKIVINITYPSSESVNSTITNMTAECSFKKAFHGCLNADTTKRTLTKDGQYLLRIVKHREDLILTFRFNGELCNYVVYYNAPANCYFLDGKPKAYDSLEDLVQEGLIILYLDMKAGAYMDLMLDLAQNNQMNVQETRKSYASRKNSYANLNMSRQNSFQPASPECDKGPYLFQANFPTLLPLPVLSPPHEEITINVRRHSFELQTFPKGTKCQICQKGNWSKYHGLECKDCGAKIHEKCFAKVVHECQPDLATIKKIFGSDLTTIVKATGANKPVFVIEKCVTQIQNVGIDSEGIYRVSGSKEQIDILKSILEKDREAADLSACKDINSLCGVLKLYLRSLPVPLITQDVFQRLVDSERPITLESVKIHLQELPLAHGITLKFLLKHLQAVATMSKINKMSAFNLSSVLSPSVTCPLDVSLNTLQFSTDILEILIRNVDCLNI